MHALVVAVDWHIVWQRIFHPGNVFARALWATIYISVVSQALGVEVEEPDPVRAPHVRDALDELSE